jgi:hypothetical protein
VTLRLPQTPPLARIPSPPHVPASLGSKRGPVIGDHQPPNKLLHAGGGGWPQLAAWFGDLPLIRQVRAFQRLGREAKATWGVQLLAAAVNMLVAQAQPPLAAAATSRFARWPRGLPARAHLARGRSASSPSASAAR